MSKAEARAVLLKFGRVEFIVAILELVELHGIGGGILEIDYTEGRILPGAQYAKQFVAGRSYVKLLVHSGLLKCFGGAASEGGQSGEEIGIRRDHAFGWSDDAGDRNRHFGVQGPGVALFGPGAEL